MATRPTSALPSDYAEVLADLKERIRSAQIQAVRTVNRELIELYWSIGKTILERQAEARWGAKVIDTLAADQHQIPSSSSSCSRTPTTSGSWISGRQPGQEYQAGSGARDVPMGRFRL